MRRKPAVAAAGLEQAMLKEYQGNGQRLDVVLSQDGEITRSRAAALIREKKIGRK